MAEFEYLRLFEQERLTCNGFNMDAYDSLTRSSSTDISSNIKVEQMLEQFGITLDSQANNDNNGGSEGSNSDSDSNTTTTVPSTAPEAPRSPQNNFIDPRHFIFALGQLNQLSECRTALNQNQQNLNTTPTFNQNESNVKEDKESVKRLAVPDESEVNRILAAKKRRLNGLFNVEDKWKKEMIDVSSVRL